MSDPRAKPTPHVPGDITATAGPGQASPKINRLKQDLTEREKDGDKNKSTERPQYSDPTDVKEVYVDEAIFAARSEGQPPMQHRAADKWEDIQFKNLAKDNEDDIKNTGSALRFDDFVHSPEYKKLEEESGEAKSLHTDKDQDVSRAAKDIVKVAVDKITGIYTKEAREEGDATGMAAERIIDEASKGKTGHILEHTKEQMKEKVGELKDKATNVKDEAKERLEQYTDQAKNKFNEYKKEMKDEVKEKVDQVKDKFEKVKDEVKDKVGSSHDLKYKAEQVKEEVKEKLGQAKDKFEKVKDEVKDKVGSSDDLKHKAEQVKDEVKEKAENFANKTKSKFELFKEEYESKAKNAKYQARNVEDEAKQKAEEAKEKASQYARQAQEKFEQLKDEAKDKTGIAIQQAKKVAEEARQKAEEAEEKAKDKLSSLREGDTLENLKQAAESVTSQASQKAGELLHQAPSLERAVNQVSQKTEEFFERVPIVEKTEEAVEAAEGYAYGISQSFRSFIDFGPTYLTEFKKRHVFPIRRDYRNIGHVGLTLAFFVGSMKMKAGLFRSLKNTAIASVLTGIVLNPESFNPFFRRAQASRTSKPQPK